MHVDDSKSDISLLLNLVHLFLLTESSKKENVLYPGDFSGGCWCIGSHYLLCYKVNEPSNMELLRQIIVKKSRKVFKVEY